MIINVAEEFKISTIQSSNSHWFNRLKDMIDSSNDDNIIIDFNDIEIKDSKNMDFRDIVVNRRTTIIIYGDRELKSMIEMYYQFADKSLDYFKFIDNEEYIEIKDSDIEDIKRYKIKADRVKATDENDSYIIPMGDVANIINRKTVLDGVKEEILELHSLYNSHIIMDFDSCDISSEYVEYLSNMIKGLRKDGVDLEVIIPDKDSSCLIETVMKIGDGRYLTLDEKWNIFEENYKPGTIGILTSYVSKGLKDMFGRPSNGKIATKLPCIYRGKDKGRVLFEVYKLDTFVNRIDYEMSNPDSEYGHPGLNSSIKRVEMNDLGFGMYCIGKGYHFSLPIQSKNEPLVDLLEREDDKVTSRKVTLPEYIRDVFDDFSVEYDSQTIEDCIRISNENMELH